MSKASDEVLVEFLQRVEEASAGSIPQATREILLGSSEREAKDELRRLLATTHSASIRNAAAIALGDLEDPEAIGIVRRLLNESTTVGARGSLLYALRGRDVVKISPSWSRA